MDTIQQGVSRRDLLKIGGIATLGALGANALNVPKAHAAELEFKPLTEDERTASIADPIYMGGSKNASGQELSIGTGPKGQVGNQATIDKHAEYAPKLHKISDRVYCSIGNAIANVTMIIGDTGIILVDSSESNETAQLDLDAFRTVTDKPVVAVICSHEHYIDGTETFVGAGNPNNVPIIAHENLVSVMNDSYSELMDTYVPRSFMMFGTLLPKEGEDASIGAGLGAFFNNPNVGKTTKGFIAPNTFIPVDTPMTPMTIDGVNLEFYPMVSDSPANINIYLPDDKIAITNHIWACFYNMYTLRGTIYRDPRDTVSAMDTILSWNAEAHVSVHGLPLIGADEVKHEITLYRDCVQYVYDQTVRFMNKGMGPDEIVESIRIPAYMIEGKATKPFYGEIEHYVRGIYRGAVGWFGADPLELHPVGKRFESQQIVDAMGGIDAVNKRARAALDDNQYAWAATLATYVLAIKPDNGDAVAVKAQAFRKMGQVTFATNTRHYYTMSALALEGAIQIPTKAPINPKKVLVARRSLALDLLRVTIDPEKALDVEASLALTFTDEDVTQTMAIHNCVGQIIDGAIENPTVELKMTYPTICDIIAGKATLEQSMSSGAVELVGEQDDLTSILDLFERKL